MDIHKLELVPTLSVVIALASLVWGIWSNVRARKFSELRYAIMELSDFKIPSDFVRQLAHAPLVISVESTGNKAAENTVLEVKTKNTIEKCEIEPLEFLSTVKDKNVHLSIEKLNPGRKLRIFITCNGNPAITQVDGFEFTHSEGKALPSSEAKQTSVITQLDFIGLMGVMTVLIGVDN